MRVSHATMTPTQWALKGSGDLPDLQHLKLESRLGQPQAAGCTVVRLSGWVVGGVLSVLK